MAFFTQTNKKKITYEFLLVSSPLEDIIFNVKIVLNGVKYYTASCLSGSWLLPREGTNHYNYQEKTLQSRIKAYRGGNLFLPLSHFTNNSDHIIPISQHSQYFLLIDLGKFAGEVFRDSEVSHVFQQYAADSGAVSEHKTYGGKRGTGAHRLVCVPWMSDDGFLCAFYSSHPLSKNLVPCHLNDKIYYSSLQIWATMKFAKTSDATWCLKSFCDLEDLN